MMNPKPDLAASDRPIRVPLRRRWREFRIRYLPILVFAGTTLLVGHLWQDHIAPTQASGLAVARQFDIRSPRDGFVADLTVEPLLTVQAGIPLLHLESANVQRLESQLAIIRAEIEAIQVGLAPVTGLQRSRIDFEDLRLEKMKVRVDLAADRIAVGRLEREARRHTDLFAAGLVSESEHDEAITSYEMIRVRIEENEAVLEGLRQSLTDLAAGWDELAPDLDAALHAAIRVKEEELRLVEGDIVPIPISSPMDGTIAAVHYANGSFVRQGDLLMTIHAPRVEYVLGYIRQPVTAIPEVGTEVQVYVPARNEWFAGLVTNIGSHMVPIHDVLARTGVEHEYALPLRVQIAPDSPVLPGERVEIRL